MPDTPSPNPILSRVVLLETIHSSPGRIRFRMRGLLFDDHAARELESALRGSPDAMSASASSVTGNLLLEFTPTLEPKSARSLVLASLAGKLAGDTPERPVGKANRKNLLGWAQGFLSPTKRAPDVSSVRASSPAAPWHNLSAEQTLLTLNVQRSGLSTREAETRLPQTGLNQLRESQSRSNWTLLWNQGPVTEFRA